MRIAIIVGLVFGVTQAFAGADGDALKQSGLTGTWAQNCAAPPSDDNWYDTYAIGTDGQLTETLMNKPDDTSHISVLTRFRRLSGKLFAYSMTQDGEDLNLVVLVEPNRQRSWSSITVTNKVYIRNGKLVSDGSETVWFNRCSK